MTRAPANLLAVRSLLLAHLNIDDTSRSADLEPAEVGIVGDAAHVGEGDSYHLGGPEQDPRGSYSVLESSRDRALTEYACALDVGDFSVSVAGKRHTLASFSMWLVAQCKAGAVDTRDIREVIYSPDGQVVRRWDRLGRRSSGDSSHRWHTHISYHRDAIKAGRDQRPLFLRYLTTIGLIEGDDMPLTAADRVAIWTHDLKDGDGTDPAYKVLNRAAADAAAAKAEAIKARLTGEAVLAAVKGVDDEGIKALITQLADAERQRDEAAAARDTEVLDLLRKWQSGELTAEQVLAKLRDLLPAETSLQN